MTSANPVSSRERIFTLDVIRGFALLGIFIMNMPTFNVSLFANVLYPELFPGRLDQWVATGSEVLFSGKFDFGLLTNIPPEDGGSSFLPKGIWGIFPALPFAIWFYLAIEELPLAAEESHDPKRDIPKATIWGLNTLVLFAILTLFLNTGVGGGAAEIGTSATPLFDGFKAVFGDGTAAAVLALIGLIGLIAR